MEGAGGAQLEWGRNKQAEGKDFAALKAKSTATTETKPSPIMVCSSNTYVPKDKSGIKKVQEN